jgi:hypothetical protein
MTIQVDGPTLTIVKAQTQYSSGVEYAIEFEREDDGTLVIAAAGYEYVWTLTPTEIKQLVDHIAPKADR